MNMDIKQNENEKLNYDKIIEERVNYVVGLRLSDIEQKMKNS